jgi:hypothetical protein
VRLAPASALKHHYRRALDLRRRRRCGYDRRR